jgi:hypothetical protein
MRPRDVRTRAVRAHEKPVGNLAWVESDLDFFEFGPSMNSRNKGSPIGPFIHPYEADDPLADFVSILFGSVLPAPISLGALRLDVSSQSRPLKIRADKLQQEALKVGL